MSIIGHSYFVRLITFRVPECLLDDYLYRRTSHPPLWITSISHPHRPISLSLLPLLRPRCPRCQTL